MEREAGTNAVEKKRLRDAIQAQVRQYLERGGRITVLGTPGGDSTNAPPGEVWAGRPASGDDFMGQLD